jgi:hypothetical protein
MRSRFSLKWSLMPRCKKYNMCHAYSLMSFDNLPFHIHSPIPEQCLSLHNLLNTLHDLSTTSFNMLYTSVRICYVYYCCVFSYWNKVNFGDPAKALWCACSQILLNHLASKLLNISVPEGYSRNAFFLKIWYG